MSYTKIRDAYRSFYKKHKDKLFAYLMRMTGDYDLSCDIMQESFTRYLEHYEKQALSVALLYTIARNSLFDHTRKQGCNTRLGHKQRSYSGDQERALMVREEYRRVLSAMHKLEKKERDILALAVTGDLSYKEIASIAGISEANVKVKVHRARLNLRKLLSQEIYDGLFDQHVYRQ
jgi:RNA polymerase sigma-70 factor (ECF subfamily)